MARSRKPARRAQSGHGKSGPSKWQRTLGPGGDISRALDPAPWVDSDSSGQWAVRHIPASQALKVYTCPGCNAPIRPGVAHLVVWRADHLFGDDRAIEERRHWHLKCWRAR